MTYHTLRSLIIVAGAAAFLASCSDRGVDPGNGGGSKEGVAAFGPQKDNTLFEQTSSGSSTLFSNGGGQMMFAGKTAGAAGGGGDVPRIRRALVKFNVSGGPIPAGSTVDSVRLDLFSVKNANTTARLVALHRAMADWGEGNSVPFNEGAGANPTVGDVTWIHTFFNTQLWTTPGGDFAVASSGSMMVSSVNAEYSWRSPQMATDVQSWLDTPAANFGWVVVGAEAATDSITVKGFATRENVTPDRRPRLVVYYTKP